MKSHTNSQGAAYFAVNFLGWATAKTPWEALAKLELSMTGKKVTVGGPMFSGQTEGVSLYYLPDEDKFKGTNFYAPVDSEGKPYGIPIYAGLSEHNERAIKKTLEHTP
jgi:hypothetical protein